MTNLLYSPDLTPSDFHLFCYLKEFWGKHFATDDELKEAVEDGLSPQAAHYDLDMQELVERHKKCLNMLAI